MKRFALIILILLLASPLMAQEQLARMSPGIAGGAAPASCTTSNDSAFFDFTASSGDAKELYPGQYDAAQFTLAATSTITQYTIVAAGWLQAGVLTGALYTDSSNTVGTIIAGTTATLNITSNGTYNLILETPKTGLSGKIWLKLSGDSNLYITVKEVVSSGNYSDIHGVTNVNHSLNIAVYGCAE